MPGDATSEPANVLFTIVESVAGRNGADDAPQLFNLGDDLD